MEKIIAGYDIGGTKCAVIHAKTDGEKIEFLKRTEFPTCGTWQEVCDKLVCAAKKQEEELSLKVGEVISGGISCGGPLDGAKGIIMSPPNLPGWDNVPVCKYISDKTGYPVLLKNDADACALAEWKYGAGKGSENMIFLTFGTGLGAGLILNSRLYVGSSNSAGEVGHVRLEKNGNVGYGKRGSFEGFCSGNGIKQTADFYFTELAQRGIKVEYYRGAGSADAKLLSEKARQGDRHALEIYRQTGRMFGKGLAVLIDILNPEIIAVGGVYMRAHEYMDEAMYHALKEECLSNNLARVKILPSELGEKIGDYGAVTAAL